MTDLMGRQARAIAAAGAADLAEMTGSLFRAVRERGPRVHCITNNVAQSFTANMLLAAGAVPSMSHAPEEVADFVRRADAVLVNLGTLDAERRAAALTASEQAIHAGKPWALDPVFVQASGPRRALAADLLANEPAVVRANEPELAALAGGEGDDAAAARLAAAHRTVVCRTGAVDAVTDGARTVRIANGHPFMTQVTAIGCAGTALMCAALAVEADALLAAAATFLLVGVAGEIAAERARGPGSFAADLLDAVYAMDARMLAERGRILS